MKIRKIIHRVFVGVLCIPMYSCFGELTCRYFLKIESMKIQHVGSKPKKIQNNKKKINLYTLLQLKRTYNIVV